MTVSFASHKSDRWTEEVRKNEPEENIETDGNIREDYRTLMIIYNTMY